MRSSVSVKVVNEGVELNIRAGRREWEILTAVLGLSQGRDLYELFDALSKAFPNYEGGGTGDFRLRIE